MVSMESLAKNEASPFYDGNEGAVCGRLTVSNPKTHSSTPGPGYRSHLREPAYLVVFRSTILSLDPKGCLKEFF